MSFNSVVLMHVYSPARHLDVLKTCLAADMQERRLNTTRIFLGFMYKRERVGMTSSAVIRRDLEDRAYNLEEAFYELMQDSREINRQLVHGDLLAPTDSRVIPWILQMRQRLNECRQWITDVHQDSTRHNFNGQEEHFATIAQAIHDAEFVDEKFFAHDTPRRNLEGLWDQWVECADNLAVDFFAWAERERYNPMVNPLAPNAARHDAAVPPVPWRNEDEDVNPGNPSVHYESEDSEVDRVARTGNPYVVV